MKVVIRDEIFLNNKPLVIFVFLLPDLIDKGNKANWFIIYYSARYAQKQHFT